MSKRKKIGSVPTFDEFMKPLIKALIMLGGSGSIEEINEKVVEITNLTNEQLSVLHSDDGRTEVEYRLAWTRTYLKKAGLIENSSRGIWALTKSEINSETVDSAKIIDYYLSELKNKSGQSQDNNEIQNIEIVEVETDWKDQLLNKLYTIPPNAFERLSQRLLRESGFVQVEITGKSGDGGIDGKGIVKISGFLSFHVIFQCKRYKGSVSPSQIRDFRGAMQGRADKGLFITTGTFTREAIKEATRDGAPPIDLIDGELLCEKLKEFKLGITTELIEKVNVLVDWFDNI